jgi:hypothetical protein
MLNGAMNELAFMRFGFRTGHGGGGFGLVLMLAVVGFGIWAISRATRSESTKS